MRLRPLTEAECYARCYGHRGEIATDVRLLREDEDAGSEGPPRHERGEPSEPGDPA